MGIVSALLMSSLAVMTPTILIVPSNFPTLAVRALRFKAVNIVVMPVGLLVPLVISMVMASKTY